MRFNEFNTLSEGLMTARELSKKDKKGEFKYIDSIIDAIADGKTLNFNVGTTKQKNIITGRIMGVRRVLGLIKEAGSPKKIPNIYVNVETTDGDQWENVRIGQIVKDSYSTGKLVVNLGNLAEAIMGSAMTAKFMNPNKEITVEDILEISKRVSSTGQYESKTNTKVSDPVIFKLTIPKDDREIFKLYTANGKDIEKSKAALQKEYPDVSDKTLKGIDVRFKDAAYYVNNSEKVKAALQKTVDPEKKDINVLSDGGNPENQSITKVDLHIYYGDQEIDLNLISLKTGTVQQFGQVSGGNWDRTDEFFKSTVGVDLPANQKVTWAFKDEDPNMDAKQLREYNLGAGNPKSPFGQAYNYVYNALNSHLAGDNTMKEYSFVEQLYKGIKFHGTRNQEDVFMVILSPSAKKAYYEVEFGQALMDVLNHYNLEVRLASTPSAHKINIYGIAKTEEAREVANSDILVTFRSHANDQAVRNIIEMGPLLKDMSTLQARLKQEKTQQQDTVQSTPAQ